MKLMQKTVWAITPEMLSTMISIAHQTNKSPEAIAKEMSRDMKNTYAVSTRGGVAVIPATGPLFRHANLLTAVCGATSYELLAQDFNKALNAPNISAILFDVDSPGGEVNGCSELTDMIYNARGKKPILAYASGSCCSGAYWIASACDKIMAADTAILGSIGVVSIFEKEDEKKTIEIVSSQSPNKRPDVKTEEGKAKIQAHIDALAEVFINKVALHRDISPKNVIENFGGGDVFVGQNAVRIGLADSLASFEAIISDLNTQSTEKSFMNDTLEKTSVDIKAQERKRMSQVLSAENVKGKEANAQALLAKTDLSASDILAILETVQVAKQTNALDVAMAQIKNPAITPSAEKKHIYARARWHFGSGRNYCQGCGEQEINYPIYRCRYVETTLKTTEGHQAWEVLLKLSEPDLGVALTMAENLGLKSEIMTELLSVGIQGIKAGMNDISNHEN